jgi:hypothetical protein
MRKPAELPLRNTPELAVEIDTESWPVLAL